MNRQHTASRTGKRSVVIHVEPEMAQRLKQLALDRNTTLQAIGVEAFKLILQRATGTDHGGTTMKMDLDNEDLQSLRSCMKGKHLTKLAKETGIARQTLDRFRNGNDDLPDDDRKTLTEYYRFQIKLRRDAAHFFDEYFQDLSIDDFSIDADAVRRLKSAKILRK